MATNRFVLAALAGGVTVFVMGFLLYGLATASFFEANQGTAIGVMREAPDMLFLFLGQLVFGVLLTVVISKWTGVGGVGPGVQVGATLGFLMGLGFDLTMYGVTNMSNLTATLADPLVLAVQMACGGAVVGTVLGQKK